MMHNSLAISDVIVSCKYILTGNNYSSSVMEDPKDDHVALGKKMELKDAGAAGLKDQVTELVREGDIHDYLREYEQAVISYDNALQIDPDCADAWFNKAITLKKMGKDTEATRSVAIALSLCRRTR